MHVIFAKPRGFCAGVVRAIAIVEKSIERFGLPLYVKHAIVHNTHEVERLKKLGVIFVEKLSEIPMGSRVIFSAHGSSPECFAEAAVRRLEVIDAACPLVTKVHNEVKCYAREGRTILLVGHREHVEVIGTKGEAPEQTIVIESVAEAARIVVSDPESVAYATQTTLSVDDTKAMVSILERRFPDIVSPPKGDICYATQNRQDAVARLAQRTHLILIFGSEESSNANRLMEVAQRAGVPALLIENASLLRSEMFQTGMTVGVSSGASTPEVLLEEAWERLKEFGAESSETMEYVEERVHFALPGIFNTKERGTK